MGKSNFGLTCVEHLVRGDVRNLDVVGQQPEENGLKKDKIFAEKMSKNIDVSQFGKFFY